MEDKITTPAWKYRAQVALPWLAAAFLPLVAIVALLHLRYTHTILFDIVKPFRPYFQDISQWGLWAASLALCFSTLADAVLTGNRRYYLASVCTLLFYIGHVGSEDSRRDSDTQKIELAGMHKAINGLPKAVSEQVRAALLGAQPKPYIVKDDDLMFYVNDLLVEERVTWTMPENFIFKIFNKGSHSVPAGYTLHISVFRGTISTKEHGWEHVHDNSLNMDSIYISSTEKMNPGATLAFLNIEYHCLDNSRGCEIDFIVSPENGKPIFHGLSWSRTP